MAGSSGPENFDTLGHEEATDELGAEAGSDNLGPRQAARTSSATKEAATSSVPKRAAPTSFVRSNRRGLGRTLPGRDLGIRHACAVLYLAGQHGGPLAAARRRAARRAGMVGVRITTRPFGIKVLKLTENKSVNEVPRNPVNRTVKLAGLPLGFAGRTALGLGKRIGGRSAELVAREIQQRTADQVFRVLGELKGGAMKFGQALSIFEAALPPELAEPYRATLTRLQESAPPLPVSSVHRVLAGDLGPEWRSQFISFDDTPAAAASIGQVHRAVWKDGRAVAVKVQYPGAGRALISDFTQLARVGRLFGMLMPGLDVKPLLDELRDRVAEELDYRLEAQAQQAFAEAYAGDPDIYVPPVVAGTDHVLVTEWMDGTPLSKIISGGSQADRNRAGILLVRFLFSGPARAGLLHADPHPGNFRLLDDGRLGVLDFGAVDRLPDGLPPFFGRLLRIMHDPEPDLDEVERELRANGFLRPGISVDLDALRAFLAPMAEPSSVETFKFSREWMRGEAARITDLSTSSVSRKFNVPPSYVLIHRVSTAGIGVLCQLECEGAFRAEVLRWVPGYTDDPLASAEPVPTG